MDRELKVPRGLTFEVRKRYSNDEGQRMLVLEIVRDDVDKMRTKNRGTTITKREAKRTAPKPDMSRADKFTWRDGNIKIIPPPKKTG